jgi:acetyl-CoA C-acetyltransferase
MHRFLYETGTTLEQCAAVTVKNKINALQNPLAAYSADWTLEDALAGPPLAWPLNHRQQAEHADGAIVMVLASEERALDICDIPIWVLGVGWCNGAPSMESREWGEVPYVSRAAQMAYRQAGIHQPKGMIDFLEVDDSYAYKELMHLEALGFCRWGEAGMLTEEGVTTPNGSLPVNTSGGSLGMGHLVEATGLAKALEVVLQLRGEAGARQLEDVEVGLAQSWRGVPTTSSAVAILANGGE